MKIAYFDCFMGISGDMILGALIDAGADLDDLQKEIFRAGVPRCKITVRSVLKGTLRGRQVTIVPLEKSPPLRTLGGLLQRLERGKLSPPLFLKVSAILTRLAKAEARVHRIPLEKVHFHEIGAVDTLVDVVGAVVGLHLIGVERIFSSSINLGGGEVRTRSGLYPVPSPAVAELLRGFPVKSNGINAELTTPTGAAILTLLAEGFSPLPLMTLDAVGYGAGSRNLEAPNLLRVMIGTRTEGPYEDEVQILETEIDDMNPQFYDHVMERLFAAGALDVFLTSLIMKKGRPGILITVLAAEKEVESLLHVLLTETTTLGVRHYRAQRRKLARRIESIETPHGKVRVKVASLKNRRLQSLPEFEDVRALSQATGKPLKEVWIDTLRAIPSRLKENPR